MFRNVLNCDSTYFTLIHSFYYLDYKFINSVTIYLSTSDSPCIAGLIPVLYFLELPITYTAHLHAKLSHYKPGWGSSKLRLPEFPHNQHIKMTRLSAPRTAFLAPRRYPWYSFLSLPQAHSAAGRINSMKKPNDPIGDRTHYTPARSAQPQPTAPHILTYHSHNWMCAGSYSIIRGWVQKVPA
jgi:hypothetical protein